LNHDDVYRDITILFHFIIVFQDQKFVWENRRGVELKNVYKITLVK